MVKKTLAALAVVTGVCVLGGGHWLDNSSWVIRKQCGSKSYAISG